MGKIFFGVVAIFVVILLFAGIRVVPTGYRGVEVRFGKVVGEPLPPDFYIINPITTSIHDYNVRVDTWSSKTSAFTSDNQRADVTFSVSYAPDPLLINTLYTQYGSSEDLATKIIQKTILTTIQNEVGKIQADQLNVSKDRVMKTTFDLLSTNLKYAGILISAVNFTNIDFEHGYEQAAEAKVIAIQQAQEAVNTTVKIREQAKQTVLTATAQAEAMKIQSQALSQNHGLVEYEAVKKWNGELPQYMFGGNTTPFIDMRSLTGSRPAAPTKGTGK